MANKTTRRSLAAAGVAALLGSTVGIGAAHPASPDAELIALCAEFRASEAAYCALYDGADENDDARAEDARLALGAPIIAAWNGMLDRMAIFRAETVEGIAARAFALAQHSGIKPGTGSYAFDFDPNGDTVTGRLLHYLLRDALTVAHGAAPPNLNVAGGA